MGTDFSITVQIFFFNQYNMRFSVLRRIPIHKNRIGFPSTRNPAFKSFPHFLPKALKDTSARLRHPHHCSSSSLSCWWMVCWGGSWRREKNGHLQFIRAGIMSGELHWFSLGLTARTSGPVGSQHQAWRYWKAFFSTSRCREWRTGTNATDGNVGTHDAVGSGRHRWHRYLVSNSWRRLALFGNCSLKCSHSVEIVLVGHTHADRTAIINHQYYGKKVKSNKMN